MTRATSGLNSQGSFAFFDPATRSWRTSAATLDSGFPMFSGTLPKRGSMRNGWLYERPMWAPPIDANASSSLLATPLPSDVTGGRTTKGSKRTGETGLRLQVKALLPTPSASDHTGGEGATRSSRREDGVTGGPSLRDIGHLLPTPRTRDHHVQSPETADRRRGVWGMDLPTQIRDLALLPTPAAQEPGFRNREPVTKNGEKPTHGSQRWYDREGGELRAAITHGPARRNETGIDSWGRSNHGRSSGASTRPPSTDGSSSSDDRHPGQLMIEDA